VAHDFKPFDALTQAERQKWREHPETRAARSLLRSLAYEEQQAMMADIEAGKDAKAKVGAVRAFELLDRILFQDTEGKPAAPEVDDFRDPAAVFNEVS
jgi:hypothetical protein